MIVTIPLSFPQVVVLSSSRGKGVVNMTCTEAGSPSD